MAEGGIRGSANQVIADRLLAPPPTELTRALGPGARQQPAIVSDDWLSRMRSSRMPLIDRSLSSLNAVGRGAA